MFSKELLELDRNTEEYMIDEMQKEIDTKKKELAAIKKEIDANKKELAAKDIKLAESEKENERLKAIIKELQSK